MKLVCLSLFYTSYTFIISSLQFSFSILTIFYVYFIFLMLNIQCI